LVIAYGVSTLVVHRSSNGYDTIWDGWIYNIAQALPLVPVMWHVRRCARLRTAWLAMGAGIVLNALANLVYTYHDQNLRPIPSPAPSDALYLLCYLASIAGVAILTQSSFGRVHVSVRLDGAVTGLAIASVAGMVWFGPLLKVSGRPLTVMVNMAYPICDLVLVVLLVAGLAPQRYRPTWPTALLMAGVAFFAIGSVLAMEQNVTNTFVGGKLVDDTWPAGLFLVGLAASVRERRGSGGPRVSVSAPAGITAVPALFGLVSVGVLVASLFWHGSAVVQSMAIGALVLVMARMWLTLREVRRSAANYQDARTDYLTGLPNRRAFLECVQSTFALGQGAGTQAGVILVDLDGFKEVNDALGHAAGDELLCVVAKRFQHRLEDRGVLARIGGDEYACVCTVESEEDLVAMAHELSLVLADPCVLDGISVRVGASIGVAASRPDESNPGDLLRCADVAMYEAKRMQCGVVAYRADTDPNGRP
jgi:diguanylate cyclase (GGDEF)-like protein